MRLFRNLLNNLVDNIPVLSLDVTTRESNNLDVSRFKDKNYWRKQKRRTFVVNAKELGIDVTYGTSILFVLYSYDIVILLLFSYEERSIYISSIWSANQWLPWIKV